MIARLWLTGSGAPSTAPSSWIGRMKPTERRVGWSKASIASL